MKRLKFISLPFLIGVLLVVTLSTLIWITNQSFAKSNNFQFEVRDCPIEGNSTFEKSGPCSGPSSEPKFANIGSSTVRPEIAAKTETAQSEAGMSEIKQIDPFGPILK